MSSFVRGSAKKSWVPHTYQEKALRFILERRSAGLFLDPGLGKTSISYAGICALKRAKQPHRTLVVAPRRPAVMVWPEEQALWAEFEGLSVGLVHGPKRLDVWGEQHDVYVVTYDGLVWLIKTGLLLKALRSKKIANLVLDELSKVKNTHTQRFKSLKKVLHLFERRWGLTGSPAANGLMDLFGECYALDLGASLGKFITHYRAQYFDAVGPDPRFPVYAPKPGAEDSIFARLKNVALRIDAEDHVKMPKLIPNTIYIDLPPKALAAYKRMEEEFFLNLDNEVFTADNAAALSQKCRQIAAGALYEDRIDPLTGVPRVGKRKFAVLHEEKLDALEDLFDELNGQPLFVGYYYGHDLAQIRKRFGADTPFIGGGTSDKESLRLQSAWNAGDLPLLLGQPDSVGHGLNLQRGNADQICFYSMTWNFEHSDQFIRRLRRQGNEARQVFVHYIMARNTVDALILSALKRKGSTQQRLHDALKDYRAAVRSK